MYLCRNRKTKSLAWRMLVVTITFCIICCAHSLPVYQPDYGVPTPSYAPAIDSYSLSPLYVPSVDVYYPQVDPYAIPQPYPAVDPYAIPQSYPAIDPYAIPQPYPAVDPYAIPQPYPAVDPYAIPQPYPAVDPYAIPQPYPSVVNPYQQVDPFAQQYPAIDPYAIPQPYPSVVNPYQRVDPFAQQYPAMNLYAIPQPYPNVGNPYPQVVLYPPVDPYSTAYPAPPQEAYSTIDPYGQLVNPYPVSPAPQQYPTVDVYSAQSQPPPQQNQPFDPYSLSIPQNYPVAPIYQQPTPSPAVQEQDTYLAVTYHVHFDYHKHCGVLAAINDDVYSSDPSPGGVNDVLPFGSFPWLAIIVDTDDNSVACLGTVIHSEYVLTAASCITKPAGKYTVYRDWDILTIYNEYEAYKSYADPVCSYWPLGLDNSTGQTQYRLGGPEAELTLLIGALEEHHTQYPSDKVLCLPSKSNGIPSPNGYQPQVPGLYASSLYSPYPQITYDNSNSYIPTGECWVAGYINSPTAILQNHPPAIPTSGQQQQSADQQQYYNNLDNSKVPRKALVRQIQCPPDHPYPGADDVCFVGVNGYDACVADTGTAVACIIDEKMEYESGADTDRTSDTNVLPEGIISVNPAQTQPPPARQLLQLAPAQQKPPRRTAVLYAVVKSTANCLPQSPPGYPPNPQQQSNYIVGSRVSPSIRAAVQDLFWQIGYDLACPTEKRSDNLLPSSNNQNEQPPAANSLVPSVLQPQQYDSSILALSYAQPTILYSPQNIYTG